MYRQPQRGQVPFLGLVDFFEDVSEVGRVIAVYLSADVGDGVVVIDDVLEIIEEFQGVASGRNITVELLRAATPDNGGGSARLLRTQPHAYAD